MNRLLKLALSLALALLTANSLFGQVPYTPSGRLTLVSNTPVMTGDVVGASTVYWTPYNNALMPIYDYDSSTWVNYYNVPQLTLTLTSSQTIEHIYDVFVYDNVGLPGLALGIGPAWSSSSGRGSGTGTTQVTLLNGIWVNANYIALTNGNGLASDVTQYQATYLGSIYMTANGQTSMQFKPTPGAGGTTGGNFLGVYNAYNRVRTISRNIDTTANWTYSTAAWRATDNSSNNRIYFLDGLQESSVDAQTQLVVNTSSSSVAGVIGVELDSTTGSPGGASALSFNTSQSSIQAFDHFNPQMGFHYISGVEYASGSTATFATDSGTTQELKVELEM